MYAVLELFEERQRNPFAFVVDAWRRPARLLDIALESRRPLSDLLSPS